MAAHLHDSVLQTLALIQKHAGDQRTVSTLARAQERDLRQWLYGDATPAEATVASALRVAAAEVEDAHGVPVEVVTVGDAPSLGPHRPLGATPHARRWSTRPSTVVARRSTSTPSCRRRRAEVFVRDRGQGFVLDEVADDRLGVRNSIIGRMERHGGRRTSAPRRARATEVRLAMDLEEKQ